MRRIAALALTMAVGAVGFTAFAGPAGAGMNGQYTVDGQIKLKGITGFVGDNLYDTPDAVGQILSTAGSPAQKAIFVVRAENEKFKTNRIAMWIEDGDCDTGDGVGRFFYQGQDVTELMDSSALIVGGVPARGHVDVRFRAKVSPGANCYVVVGMASDRYPGGADYVVAQIVSTQGGGVM